MNKPFIEIDAEQFTLSSFETEPIEGYEPPINEETKDKFPNCCPFHKSVYNGAKSWYLNFPNCCEEHQQMALKPWFNKNNYLGIAEKIVKQLSYTEYHILKRIDIEDWYEDITDYIDYNVTSFGHPAIGLHIYLGNLKHYLESAPIEVQDYKKQRILEFIKTYYYKPSKDKKTDLNILYDTYSKWLRIFPFEISFFTHLKPQFENNLPILKGQIQTNRYTGITKAEVHSKDGLIDALINITNHLLTNINTTTLYDKGLLTEPSKLKLEFVLNDRKMKLKQGYSNNSKDEEQRYRRMIKEWLRDEKNFVDEIIPLISSKPPEQVETNTDRLKQTLTEHGFFKLPKVNQLPEPNKDKLVELIFSNPLPYKIALFDYLGFLEYLSREYFTTGYKRNQAIAKWLKTKERAVKGNIHVLNDHSKEDRTRYTAHLQKNTVKKDYEKLK